MMNVQSDLHLLECIVVTFIVSLACLRPPVSSSCEIPEYLRGEFYSTDRSTELKTIISEKTFSNEQLGVAECYAIAVIPDTTDAFNRSDLRILFFNRKSSCYQCQDLHFRTPNVIQHRFSSCLSSSDVDEDSLFDDVCSHIHVNMDFMTMFRIDIQTVNCKATIEGCYGFSYEVDYGGGSICNSPHNVITACQLPGSVYVDNQVFDMSFGECSEVAGSLRAKIRFKCLGTWQEANGNVFSAVADLGQVHPRDRFRCLLTRYDQEMENNERRFSMSRWASCAVLQTPYEGDIRLIIRPTIFAEIPSVEPGCRFPRNFTGVYYMGGEYDNSVTINTTHIYKVTTLNQYEVFNSYFICMAHVDSRYLTYTVDEGRCETHFVCYDFLERHHSIIRFRMGKPVPARLSMLQDQEYLTRIFRETCTWSTFTYERSDEPQEWIYFYFMMNPPSPVPCPIGGRYTFIQEGSEEELYKTEVGGMTERPRHTIDCKEDRSELKSCDALPSKLTLDVSYCASLDHTGRPVGEYDVPDRELICVGYWMENMKSYMLTYDLLDPVSNFRCWVYERVGWREIHMSRSSSAHCDVKQTATSNTPDEGSSLRLVLKENERLFDECSQRYDTGENPWRPVLEIFVLDGKTSSSPSDLRSNRFDVVALILLSAIVRVCIF